MSSTENTTKPIQKIDRYELWKMAFRRFLHHKFAVISAIILFFYFFIAIFYPLLPLHSYKKAIPIHHNLPPSLTKNSGILLYEKKETEIFALAKKDGRSTLNEKELQTLTDLRHTIETETYVDKKGHTKKTHERRYLWGTDYLGRDLLSRVIYGSRVSMLIGMFGAFVAVLIGTVIGTFAGFRGGLIDYWITRFIDVLYGFPFLFVIIILMAAFGRNIFLVFFAIALISWLTVARVVRGQIISLKNSEFVKISQVLGAPTWWTIRKHLIPNTLNIVIVFVTLRVPGFIMSESFLSYLGLGLSAPFASWGTLIRDSVDTITSAPWQLFFPAAVMCLFLICMNFLGDGLRDTFDPKHQIK